MIRVLIADDNALLRMGLTSLLGSAGGIEVVAEAGTGVDAVRLAEEVRPDVAVLDVRMPEMDGVQAASRMPPGTRVLMLTHSEEPQVIRTALDSGAVGYLVHGCHSPEQVVEAVRGAAHGMTVLGPAATRVLLAGSRRSEEDHPAPHSGLGAALTAREVEVMTLVADGRTNSEIARTCFLAEKTVKNHINRIFAKLGVVTRAEAVSIWLRSVPPGSHDPAPRPNGRSRGQGPQQGPEQGPWTHDDRFRRP